MISWDFIRAKNAHTNSPATLVQKTQSLLSVKLCVAFSLGLKLLSLLNSAVQMEAQMLRSSTSQPVNVMDTGSTLILKLVECDRIFRKQMMIETNLDLTSWPPYFENFTRNPSMPWLCHLIQDMYPIYFQMSQVFSTKKPNSKSHPTFQKKNMPTYQCPKESSGTKQNISINQ